MEPEAARSSSGEVTQLLALAQRGDPDAAEKLIPLIYDELRLVAARCLRRERGDHTLQPTALANEAWLRIMAQREVSYQNRTHFFSLAASMIRRILLDYARRRSAAKRGGGGLRVTFDEGMAGEAAHLEDLIAVDSALAHLEQLDARQSRLVELRFFGGLSIEETAEVLSLSPATVKREWNSAKAWLRRELGRQDS